MKNRFSTILIDDEPLAVNRLHRLLARYEEIEIIADAGNGESGLQLIELHQPDLVFLDIQMPVLTGFEMLKRLKYIPKVIFTTAYEEHAIKAFEENSIDYLLKPIEPERLDKAIEKLKRLSKTETVAWPEQLNLILKTIGSVKEEIKSVPVKIGDRILLIRLDQIVYFEAKDKYVYLHTEEGVEYLVDFTLSALEEKLPVAFVRVHRAYMINRNKIKEIHKGFSNSFILVMKDKNLTKIYSGRSFSENVKKVFEI